MLSSSTALSYLDNTDWIRKSLNDWSRHANHSLSVRGGSNKLNYMASVGYYERRGSSSTVPMTITVSISVRISFRALTAISIFRSSSRPTVRKLMPTPSTLQCSPKCTAAAPHAGLFSADEDPLVNPNLYAGQDGTNPIDLMKNAGTSDNINNDVSGQANLRITAIWSRLAINLTASRYTART